MALSAGEKLGPYELQSLLGEGGMGQVWKARDTRLNRTVAVKVSKERFSERFEREARAIAALNHPHICTLFDVGADYLVMEYVDGKPIAGPLPPASARRYGVQIAKALDAAHRLGMVHRDLKPANILITKSGIKLLDFGLAEITAAAAAAPEETVTRALPRKVRFSARCNICPRSSSKAKTPMPGATSLLSAAYFTKH
jgi:eukaryotic-like serine/threonine-protein kinase